MRHMDGLVRIKDCCVTKSVVVVNLVPNCCAGVMGVKHLGNLGEQSIRRASS